MPAKTPGYIAYTKKLMSINNTVNLAKSLKKSFAFICYAREDIKYRDQFIFETSAVDEVAFWSDIDNISVGALWENEIDEAIQACKVGVLLVSNHFFKSSYIKDNELPKLLKAYKKGKIILIPVVITPCMYEYSLLRGIQAFNTAAPMSTFDEANQIPLWHRLIREIVKHCREGR